MRKEDRVVRYNSNQEGKGREFFFVRETGDSSYAEGNTPAEREHFVFRGQEDAGGRTSGCVDGSFEGKNEERHCVSYGLSFISKLGGKDI